MGEEIKIPERWKEDYEQCGEKSCLICTLIREIATLEQQLAERDRTIARLKSELERYAVTMAYDYPSETPIECGLWCSLCRNDVEVNGRGHKETCILAARAKETE